MKPFYPRAIAALLITLGLAACGGKASFDVSGTIAGLTTDGLILENKGDKVFPAAFATTFTFPNRIDYGTEYNITVLQSPAHLTCTPQGGVSGSAGHFTSINGGINCTRNAYAIGGSITGLRVAGLVLINGSTGGSVAPLADATTFTLPNVEDGQFYGVTVRTNPPGQECTVSSGTGLMGTAAVSNIAVTCKFI